MPRLRIILLLGLGTLLAVAGLLAAAAAPAAAQAGAAPSAGYSISWYTVDGGGGVSSSGAGGYSLSGTAGQPDAGTLTSSSPAYTLAGGYWAALIRSLFLPLVQR